MKWKLLSSDTDIDSNSGDMFVSSEARWLCDSWSQPPLMACAGCISNCNAAPGAVRAHISH